MCCSRGIDAASLLRLLATLIFLGAIRFADASGDVSFVSFSDFLQGVKSTSFNSLGKRAVGNEAAFEEMRSHILKMYSGVTKADVTSFVYEGQHVDCIAIMEQPTVVSFGIKQIETPPLPTSPPPSKKTNGTTALYADSPLKLGLKDQFGNAVSCSEKTIPMTRLTMEKLTQFPTLNEFFAKYPSSARTLQPRTTATSKPTWDPVHKQAIGKQSVVNYGANLFMDFWKPVANFSLSRVSFADAHDPPHQTLDGGWVVYPDHFQTPNGVLFLYWSSGTQGCYNLDCPAFVQVSHNWNLGVGWAEYSTQAEAVSQRTGNWLQLKLVSGNWWLFMRASGGWDAIGYYPATKIFGGGQLSKFAQRMEFGGEVGRMVGHPWPPMGSGALSTDVSKAAIQLALYYTPHDENGGVGVWTGLKPQSDFPCYSASMFEDFSPTSVWGKYIHYGGPGGAVC